MPQTLDQYWSTLIAILNKMATLLMIRCVAESSTLIGYFCFFQSKGRTCEGGHEEESVIPFPRSRSRIPGAFFSIEKPECLEGATSFVRTKKVRNWAVLGLDKVYLYSFFK